MLIITKGEFSIKLAHDSPDLDFLHVVVYRKVCPVGKLELTDANMLVWANGNLFLEGVRVSTETSKGSG